MPEEIESNNREKVLINIHHNHKIRRNKKKSYDFGLETVFLVFRFTVCVNFVKFYIHVILFCKYSSFLGCSQIIERFLLGS